MADNHFDSTVEALFKGMDHFVTTKTVVGEAVKIDDAIILPFVDVSCGSALVQKQIVFYRHNHCDSRTVPVSLHRLMPYSYAWNIRYQISGSPGKTPNLNSIITDSLSHYFRLSVCFPQRRP